MHSYFFCLCSLELVMKHVLKKCLQKEVANQACSKENKLHKNVSSHVLPETIKVYLK